MSLTDDRTDIARRMQRVATLSGQDAGNLEKDPWQPRWSVKGRWIEFECGCRAEKCAVLVSPRPYDPIVFGGLPQQGVYDYVCHRHWPGMNKYVHFGRFADFGQWRRTRRAILMGRAKAIR